MDTLPDEIVDIWVDKKTNRVHKRWYAIWCAKRMHVNLFHGCIDLSCSVNSLHKFKNLWSLTLGEYSDVSPSIKTLTMLKTLKLCENIYVKDKHLRCLTNITSLSLTRCKQITMDSLTYLTNLIDLTVTYRDIGNLSLLTNITKLDITRCNIDDDQLLYLTKLRRLSLYVDQITDRSIVNLTNLEWLSLMTPSVTDTSIKQLTNLTYLDLYQSPNITCESLKSLPTLTHMRISCVTISNFACLTNLRTLEVIGDMGHTGRWIKYMTNLTSLSLHSVLAIEEDDILMLTNLRHLEIGHCRLDKNKLRLTFPM